MSMQCTSSVIRRPVYSASLSSNISYGMSNTYVRSWNDLLDGESLLRLMRFQQTNWKFTQQIRNLIETFNVQTYPRKNLKK